MLCGWFVVGDRMLREYIHIDKYVGMGIDIDLDLNIKNAILASVRLVRAEMKCGIVAGSGRIDG
jgi:hypothetical protein